MRYEVKGQEDISLAVGAAGDKTLAITVAGSHVSLHNNDPEQAVMYALVAAPVFPGGWKQLSPGASVMEDMAGSVALRLRKKRWIRFVSAHVRVIPAGDPFPADDITVYVEVAEVTY